jgi:menaquinone-dependent protoporphyrinogen IX oxidase
MSKYYVKHELYKGDWVINRWFIILGELEKKNYTCFQIILIVKSLCNVEWDLKWISNLIKKN